MVIREFKEQDRKDLLNLYNRCFNKNNKISTLSPTSIIIVIEENNTLIGMASLDILTDIFKNIKYGYINNVCIDKTYQGKHLSNYLMNHIHNIAIKNNLSYIMLTSNKKRLVAHKLYKSLDYKEEDTTLFKKYFK